MNYRTNRNNSNQLSILGFGIMRLPSKNGAIDEPRAIAMIRHAVDEGINYFDTAYIYHRGKSEALLGKALAGHARRKVFIATKLPTYMVGSLEGAKKIFETQLKRLQTDYIDYYLLHMLVDKAMFDRMVSLGVMTWLERLKENGIIHNIGFSFHGVKADFEALLKAYPWDFCQIQYNYLDENSQATKAGLLMAADMGIPVIVMEPLRGGRLVTHLPAEVKREFETFDPKRSSAQWALRWVWNHPQVTVVLSGMSDEAQLEENIAVAGDARADMMSEDELAMFSRVKEIILEKTKVPCTGCAYCMPCPHGVDIPECFSYYNEKHLMNDKMAKFRYMRNLGGLAVNPSNASQCVACGKCESQCPQSIEIIKELKNVSREMEGPLYRPIVWLSRKMMRIKG
ncbi:MAG: aldo/keto reductase [Clostridiales bacterium]|nr:aldo/keto reductase [Clostridiales bacterium]